MSDTGPEPTPQPTHGAHEAPATASRTWVWIALGVVAVLLAGGAVWLLVGGGKVAVPDTVGKSRTEAEKLISAAGLTVGTTTEKTATESSVAPGTVLSQTPPAGDKVSKGSKVDLVVAAGPTLVKVPDVVGKSKSEAEGQLAAAGLVPRFVDETSDAPKGQTVEQLPTAGSSVTTGSVVGVAVSSGPSAQTGTVPDVVGKAQADAENEVRTAGFVPVTSKDYSDTVPAGQVMAQLPDPGTVAPVGGDVSIVVSLGKTAPPLVTVPSVVGKSQADAESAIKAAGLVPVATKGYSGSVAAGSVISQTPGGGSSADKGGEVAILVSQGEQPASTIAVPNVVGMAESDAVGTLESAGFKAKVVKEYSDTVGAGKVASQLPGAGSPAAKGSEVTVVVSLGKKGPSTVSVPDVTGKNKADAESAIKAAGLVPEPVTAPSPTVPEGTVSKQQPKAGKSASPGSQVTILVSTGKLGRMAEVPDVKGKAEADAIAAVEKAGFKAVVIADVNPDVPAGTVYGQMPEAGRKLPAGSSIVIGVSKGEAAAVQPLPAPEPEPMPTPEATKAPAPPESTSTTAP